jgi:hypothetical protein
MVEYNCSRAEVNRLFGKAAYLSYAGHDRAHHPAEGAGIVTAKFQAWIV